MVVSSKPGRDDWNAIDAGSGKPLRDPPDIISIARRPSTPDDAIEAPFVLARSGLFYLFVSLDHCCRGAQSDFKIAVGRSQRIDGPYADKDGVPMLDGGGTIIL
jgi:arabinan endo-1,5-alpha-L-arabinosidase